MPFRSHTPSRIPGYRRQKIRHRAGDSEKLSLSQKIQQSALYTAFAAGICGIALLCLGLIIRYISPSEVISIQAFNVPADFQQHTVTGSSVASIFADQMEGIFKDGKRLWDKPQTDETGRESQIVLTTNNIPWRLKVEYKGISFDLLAAWQKLTSRTFEITGDLVSGKSGIVLHARIRGPETHARFSAIASVGPYALDDRNSDVIERACRELALSLVSDFAPPIAATYQLNHQRPDIAETIVARWLPEEPTSYYPYLMLGVILDRTGRSEDAIASLQTALTKSSQPDILFRIHNSIGNAYFSLHDYGKALAEYSLSADLAPGNTIPQINIAAVYFSTGEVDKAIDTYEQLVSKFPNDPFIRYNLGTTLLSTNKDSMLDRAITHLNAAVQLRPNDGRAFNNLASAFYDKGEIDKALNRVLVAIQLEPDNTNFRKHLLFLQSEKERQTSNGGLIRRPVSTPD